MKYAYYVADVFTKDVFNGAQIAVFPHAEGLSDRQMQLIARELNLSETVFVFETKEATRRIMRIFTPLTELNFAGHPIIATAFVLGISGALPLNNGLTSLVFAQETGDVQVNVSVRDGNPVFVQFTRSTSAIIDRFSPTDEELAAMLSLPVSALDHKKYAPRLVCCAIPYLVVPVRHYENVREARFNYTAWIESSAPQTVAQEILLFSPKNPYPDADFNVRLLGSYIGVYEDPPVGNAMPAFAHYLCSFDFMQNGTYTFNVDRGDARTRRSLLQLEMDYRIGENLMLRVGGEAVLVAEGMMNVPE